MTSKPSIANRRRINSQDALLSKNDTNSVKIAVIDDHQLFLDGISLVIRQFQENCEVIGFAEPMTLLAALDQGSDFDMIVCDLVMGNMNGLIFIDTLRSQSSIPVLMLSGISTSPPVEQMKQLGAQGFIHKSADNEILSDAIGRILKGGEYFEDESLSEYPEPFDQFGAIEPVDQSTDIVVSNLTDRQIEVLRLMSQGATNKEISAELDISENTVKSHLKIIFDGLKVNKRTACVRVAQAQGII